MLARRLSLAAVAVVLVACLAACRDSGAGPSTLPDAEPIGTDTAIPQSSAATPGQDAVSTSAERFVHGYFATFNEAQASGDMTAVKALAAATCLKCTELTNNVEGYFSRDQRVQGGAWEVKSVNVTGGEQNAKLVDVTALIAAADVVDSTGATVESYDGTPDLGFIFNVVQDSQGNWLVVDIIALGPRG